MHPHSAGHSRDKNPDPIHSQPQWQNTSEPFQEKQLYSPRAVVPPGLQCLVEVEEVTLQKNVFLTRSGQTLFTIRKKLQFFGPSFNLRFRNAEKRDVVSLYTMSGGVFCRGDTQLKITVLPESTIGFVKVTNSSRKMNASIQMRFGESAFTAELPLSRSEKMIEILNANGSCPVARITTEGEKKSSKVIFQFPIDMEATVKTTILATFLYMMYEVNQYSRTSSSSSDTRWQASADDHGGFLTYGGIPGDFGGGGGDWGSGGGDCGGGGDWGGGDCGGGGGDCGGGGDGGGGCD